MKLHYSQTVIRFTVEMIRVSVPYEITLLSNLRSEEIKNDIVSVPYEITLLSNTATASPLSGLVSVPYEITLLSNRAG